MATMAFVLDVMCRSSSRSSTFRVSDRISTNTGDAPRSTNALTVDGNVNGETMNSSPGLMFSSSAASSSACVHDVVSSTLLPSASSRSSVARRVYSPSPEMWPRANASATYSSSLPRHAGRLNGIFSTTRRSCGLLFRRIDSIELGDHLVASGARVLGSDARKGDRVSTLRGEDLYDRRHQQLARQDAPGRPHPVQEADRLFGELRLDSHAARVVPRPAVTAEDVRRQLAGVEAEFAGHADDLEPYARQETLEAGLMEQIDVHGADRAAVDPRQILAHDARLDCERVRYCD